MSSGESGVIHTKSSYAEGLTVSITNDEQSNQALLIDAYNYLYDQEKAFYQSIFTDVTTLDDFLARIRKIFSDAKMDAEYLKRFTNVKLTAFEPKKEPFLFDQNLKLIIDVDKGKEIFKNFKSKTKNMEVYSEGIIALNISVENVEEIKRVLNTFSKRSGNSLFQDSSNAISQNLIDTLRFGKFNKEVFKIVGDKQAAPAKRMQFNIKDVSKVEFNKENIDFLQKHINEPGNKEKLEKIRLDMIQSLGKMRNFMFAQLSGCSEDMQRSVEEVWGSLIPEKNDINSLKKIIFFEGDNAIKALYGNPGEFANAVWLTYLGKKSDTGNTLLIKMIGNVNEGGEQPRSDIQILTDLGASVNFQTKNVEDTGRITTNSTLELILPNFTEEGIADILVNHFSNTTYGGQNSLESIQDLLSERFYHAMNLNVQSGLDEFQTNTFYFIGGDKLVPGSQIIKNIYLKPTNPSFQITGSKVVSEDDEGYRKNFEKYSYWEYPKGEKSPSVDSMIATEENTKAFKKAQQNIRISTSFSVNALISSHNFRIFE